MADAIHIRPIKPAEWELFKNFRLHALKSTPGVYCGTYEEAASRDDQSWKGLTTDNKLCIFGLFDHEKLIGITGVFTSRENPKHCAFGMTFINSEYRSRGLSDLLYKARIKWALEQPHLKKIIVSHRRDNEPSKYAMIKHGFQYTEQEKITWPDGAEEFECKYELDLEKLRQNPL